MVNFIEILLKFRGKSLSWYNSHYFTEKFQMNKNIFMNEYLFSQYGKR